MKCPACQVENKDQAKNCRKCGMNLQLPPLWVPTWAWHRKTLLILFVGVLIAFFAARVLLKPYVRSLPPEITPWMHEGKSEAYPR